METGNQKKWYNNKSLIIILFFTLPPLGIYAMLKYNTKVWKKVLYIVLALIPSFFLFFLSMYIVIPKEKLEKAKVKSNEKETFSSLKKDSLNHVNSDNTSQSKEILISEKDILKFNKKWTDSVVKSWKGKFIISGASKTKNRIELELSKEATKSFYSNKRNNLSMYQRDYDNNYKSKFRKENTEVKVDFIPNKKLSKEFNTSDWVHPIFKNKGIKIYSGNEFYKEYLGTLDCKYKDPTDGILYFIVKINNRESVKIKDYLFNDYWVKKKDAEKHMGIGINNCY